MVSHLQSFLTGARITEIYSQERDVLVLRLINKRELFIKAHLKGNFACLSFPEKLSRARRNTIDLFSEVLDREISSVEMVEYDRSFYLSLEGDYQLVFKMHGHRSNILLLRGGLPHEVFKNSLRKDKEIQLADLAKTFPTEVDFQSMRGELTRVFPVLGRELASWVENQIENSKEDEWTAFKAAVNELNELDRVWVRESEAQMDFSLIELEGGKEYEDPIIAVTTFCSSYLRKSAFQNRKHSLGVRLRQRLKKTHSYLKKTESQLNRVLNEENPKELADLIMAYLFRFEDGSREVALPRFDGSGEVTVKLKENQSAAQKAESLYKKSKNKRIEIDMIKKNLRKRESEIKILDLELKKIDEADNLKELEQIDKKWKKESAKEQATEFHEYEFDGFKIRVGKNARNNDKLTFNHGYKEDLWLHVKDARGSHVLLKYRSDRKFSKTAIERAAQLAAWYSKRNTEGLVPVIYTPRKFVRKRKGDPPGMVVVDKEQVLLVEPENIN